MASVTSARSGVRAGDTEQRKKQSENRISRKTANLNSKMSEKQTEIRSPLMERSNRALLKKNATVKAMEQKTVKPINKENIQPVVNKNGKTMTFSQSFLKTKIIKERQLNGKQKLESAKAEEKPKIKPVLGAYRGKIVQSKINSFRKPPETTGGKRAAPERKTITQSTTTKPNIPTTRKPMVRPSSAIDKKPKVPPKKPHSAPVASQVKTSTRVTVKSKVQPETTRRTTQVIPAAKTKVSNTAAPKSRNQHVTVRRTTHVFNHTKPLEGTGQKGPEVQKTELKKGLDSARTQIKKRVTVGPISSLPSSQQPSGVGKYPKVNETAAERKARLAEWRASKGKVMKRPPSSVTLSSTYKVQKDEAEIKREPEEEPRQLFWATMAEEDEQEWFTLKVNQIFTECQKLIDEGIPKEEILSILEKQIESIPEAKKLSRYWECLARLEQREGQPYKVIEVCEEAVGYGAQPLEELRAILANTLDQLKTEPGDIQKQESEGEALAEELKDELKPESEESAVKEKRKRGRRRAMKYEPKDLSSPEKPSESQSSPEKREDISSVIRFNITTTPHLEKMRKLQMIEGDSNIKGYKFLTPVRRSSRLERKSHIFPDMLKDHDPCIAGIAQLEDLEDPESCPSAYIFRKNEALKEINAKSLTKK